MKLLLNTKSFFTNKEEVRKFLLELEVPPEHQLSVALPSSVLWYAKQILRGSKKLTLAAQDISPNGVGAHTGQENGTILYDCGAQEVIIGHPETRLSQALLEEDILAKLEEAKKAQLAPILYIGNSYEHDQATLAEKTEINIATLLESNIKVCTLVFESAIEVSEEELKNAANFIKKQVAKKIKYSLLLGGAVTLSGTSTLARLDYIDGFAIGRQALTKEQRDSFYESLS